MRRFVVMAAVSTVVGTFSGVAMGATNLGIAQDYNAFILQDINASGGDTEGRLAVGRDANLQFYGVGSHLTNSHGTRDDFIVGRNMNAMGGWQVFNGNAVWGNSLIAGPTTPNGSTFHGTPIDFAAATIDLTNRANQWSAISPNGTAVYDGFATLTITGTDPNLNIIDIPGALWSNPSISSRFVNAPAGSTVLINISGTTNSMSGGLALTGGVTKQTVLWNFYETTALNSSFLSMQGSVLAPLAHLELNGGNFEGISVLGSAHTFNGGEFHNYGFDGKIPEPATLALLGLAALGVRRVRTR